MKIKTSINRDFTVCADYLKGLDSLMYHTELIKEFHDMLIMQVNGTEVTIQPSIGATNRTLLSIFSQNESQLFSVEKMLKSELN